MKKKNLVFSLLQVLLLFVFHQEMWGQTNKENNVIEKNFFNESKIRISIVHDHIIRIQVTPEKKEFSESGLNRYGFIQDQLQSDVKLKQSESKNTFSVETTYMKLTGNKLTGKILITDPSEERIFLHQLSCQFSDSSSTATFNTVGNEDWIGFGTQPGERIYHRGYMTDCKIRNVKSYIPVPYFMSSLGTGILVNTTYEVIFDMCKSNPDQYFWTDKSGAIDYYVIVGNGFKELIDQYTNLTGKPKLPPLWSFGLWYLCRTQASDYEAVNDALNFRRERIPCDVIGLEPGWMEKNYDFSTTKGWSKSRFPIPGYAAKGPHTFIAALKRMGFKLELWLCNNYDLSYEEERRFTGRKSVEPQKKEIGKVDPIVEADEHLVKSVQANNNSTSLSVEEEPWFKHLEKFVDHGADFFKQDGANQVLEYPGKIWGNGMTDAEMHNLYPLFYSRQMYEGFKSYANRRPVVFTVGGWTGFQSWCGTWTGDVGGELNTLAAMLNTSIVGHSWCTNDMEVVKKEGIHFGYLQPWSQINSWNYFRMPWIQGAELTAMHKDYAELRSKLVPYLYSWGYYATKTGWPLLLPLTLEFPDDKNCNNNIHQYLLGRDLMVGIFLKKIYFPAGLWKD